MSVIENLCCNIFINIISSILQKNNMVNVFVTKDVARTIINRLQYPQCAAETNVYSERYEECVRLAAEKYIKTIIMNVYVSNIVVLMSPHYSFDGQSNDGYDGASETQEKQEQLIQDGNI